MFANPHSNLHERYRQHRRQISTPNVLEAVKVPTLPAQALQRIQAHRRGQSLDQRSVHAQRSRPMQDGGPSITNPAVPQQPQMVAGGAPHQQFPQSSQFPQQLTPMPMMPECQSFPSDELQALSGQSINVNQPDMAYMIPDFVNIGNHCVGNRPMVSNLNLIQQQQLHNPHIIANSALDGQILDNSAFNIYQHGLRPQTNNLSVDTRRLSVHSDVSPSHQPHTPKQTNSRKSTVSPWRILSPSTPDSRLESEYFPITPATTPFKKTAELAQYSTDVQTTPSKEQRFSAAQAAYMQRAKSLQGVAGTTFSQPKIEMLSPHNTGSFEIESFNTFGSQQGSTFEFSESENLSQGQYASSSATSSFQSSPELAAMPSPEDHNEKAHKIPIFPAVSSRISHKKTLSLPASTSPAKPKLSPRVASIDNLNLDARVHASIKETGVTIDEIASYISGPDPEDGKWVCIHPGCERRFGRKENIKSHVQTHLGDRQYKCDHCNKCFVRGHDLKRHAKIHTGDKPYECLCGNVFARHDALTRHRQRGMCIGGYKGIVRKTTKRGRPKKHRPEMDERQDKAAKTRQRVADKTSFDSLSGTDVAPNSPPSEVLENMSLHGDPSPKEEMPAFNQPDYSLPPSVFTFTPPASPGHNLGNRPSPNQSYRSLTPSSEDEMLPSSPIKRPLERIAEESGLPYIEHADLYTEIATSAADLSSPHTAPTLADSCHGSDLDIFISPDSSANFKHEFPELSDMAAFPDYTNTSTFDAGLDLFSSKNFSTVPSMNDDFFSFQFQADDQPLDVMAKEFFAD
ncbi:putative C2H2 transcription factor (Swi5) [Aspergillus clavatus NRRL 1]|uniref:C2H2 transcription factor (Swi5), putative n=1 Tax=Aspergillus clavatus (strain ATCC 1007 / CBS 513.65 / DSM 816 / NCTC 3887 / NRRL 1 / QM 1276 / 107) TaxID=344612 RepID=A1CKM5_ASPCL|nr:C2H2 transcription factor (Swi5), putative [Aspergillus clavatus NRRL 1]EAW09699.1 C2H2 transcription factor (Swi5), putative [Aspergillus clavatus NRRL 1]